MQSCPGRERDVTGVPIHEHRHLLLGAPAVRSQRRVEGREVVLGGSRADHRLRIGEDHDVTGPIEREIETPARLGVDGLRCLTA